MPPTVQSYIAQQPQAFERLLSSAEQFEIVARSLRGPRTRKVWLAGSGTSMFAGAIAAAVWEQLLGIDCEVVSPLELLNAIPGALLSNESLVIAISQSGETWTLAEGVERARQHGAATVAVTSDARSLLAGKSDAVLDSKTGDEDVFAKTKGFTCTALAASLLGIALGREGTRVSPDTLTLVEQSLSRLPVLTEQAMRSAYERTSSVVRRFRDVDSLFVAGSGFQLPAAHEGALKILEIAKIPVVSQEIEESFHGYFNALGRRTGLVLLSGTLPQQEKLQAFRDAAATIEAPLCVMADASLVGSVFDEGDVDAVIPDMPFTPLSPLLGVLPMQILAYAFAEARGVSPNRTRYPELYQVFRTKTMHS